MNLIVLLTCLVVCFLPFSTNGAKILILTPMGSRSMKNFFLGAAEALAERNHSVTLVSMYKNKKDIPNIREIILPGPSIDIMLDEVFTKGPDSVMKKLFTKMPTLCSESLGYFYQTDAHKEKYDLIIMSLFFNFCYHSVTYQQKVPFIYTSPAGLIGPFHQMTGSINFPSLTPNKVLKSVYPLSFTDRFFTVILDTVMGLVAEHYIEPEMLNICKERSLCPEDMPALGEFHDNVSLVLLNDIRSLEIPPRPYMPNVIYAGGIHCHQGNSLPKDLEEWVQSSGDAGFVFFSMGSAIKPSFLSEKYRRILINAFAALDQKVLFKWDEPTMSDLPPNVKLGSWLPQQDLLAHPKIKLFITHGGLHSLMEATYHAVPVIGIPIFADQYSNVMEAQLHGWVESITWDELEEIKLVKLIQKVMQNEKMKEKIKERAAIMTDQRRPPKEEISYWVEYVLRHNGADHLKSPVRKTPWYILYNVDVWVTLVFILFSLVFLSVFILYFMILRCCCRKSRSKKMKKT